METQSVLVVDDSVLNANVLADSLKDNYEVAIATSGKQALDILQSRHIDLILLDVVMPEMDGYELCQIIKSDTQNCNIPIIFVTARHDEEDEKKGLELGAIDYIIKPIKPSITKIRVKNHLELKKYRDLLENMSYLDGLTGLANRRYFNEMYDKEWRRALRHGEWLSVIMIDIDYFKKYNDFYGHLLGDDCLRLIGSALGNAMQRASDIVVRYGGEEFLAILPSTTPEGAMMLAEKVRTNIELLHIQHEHSRVSKYVTVSVGVASVIPNNVMIPNSLIGKADIELYRAKQQGRNRICQASEEVVKH